MSECDQEGFIGRTCFCTGECQRQQGWTCPKCGASWSPFVYQCPSCRPQPQLSCTCPDGTICGNVICPRRVQITSNG